MTGRRAAAAVALALVLAACGGGGGGGDAGLLRIPVGDAPQRGPDDAWVTVIEFSDFQCPFCAAAAPQVQALLADFPADVRLLYRHFPLPQHPNAVPAAEAAECARAQGPAPDGLFWPLHDALFASQGSWSAAGSSQAVATFGLLAGQLAGLDRATWDACMADHAGLPRIAADQALARPFLRGTPTFVVNGTAVPGVTDLRAAVASALASAQASGIPRAEYYDKAVLGL